MKLKKSYLVCSTPRTGSTLLCQMLRDLKIAGNPDEFFFYVIEGQGNNWKDWLREPKKIDILSKYIEKYTTLNGVFGVKVIWSHFYYLIYQLRFLPLPSLEADKLIAEVFTNPSYILTIREDKVRQAVSLWRAQQTGAWNSLSGQWLSPFWTETPKFDYERIEILIQEIKVSERSWKWFFDYHDIQPLVVVYEELVSAPEETLRRVLEFLGFLQIV